MLIVDDLLTVVGSANMDFRSFEHNFEINAFVYGQDFNTAMRRVFDEDLRSCRRLIPSEWLRRPLPQRLSESFMRLFSPRCCKAGGGDDGDRGFRCCPIRKNIATPRKARSL